MSDYPRMLYKAGGHAVADSEDDEAQLLAVGWSREPRPEHFQQFDSHHTQRIDAPPAPQAQSQPSTPNYNIDEIVERVVKVLDERGLLRRPPGRPPATSL